MAKRKVRNAFLTFLIILCFIVMIISGYIFFEKVINDHKGVEQYNNLRKLVVQEKTVVDGEITIGGKENEIPDEAPPITVDFDELHKINPDVVGWIYVCGVNEISYPILKGETNDTYLHTSIEGDYLYAGSIFMEDDNSSDFTDPNTIIYGHNMANGSMFAGLGDFFTAENAYEESPYFWILTPNGNYKYEIFSAFRTEERGEAYSLFHIRGESFLQWLLKMSYSTHIATQGQQFKATDHIVTLSTCMNEEGYRRVVLGVCLNNENLIELESEKNQ